MNNVIRIILSCFFIYALQSCSEDGIDETGTGSLVGTVVSSGNNTPLANVKITTTPSSTTVFTNDQGKFAIDQIAAGEYSVQAELDDFQTAFEGTTITIGNTSNVVFELDISTANNRPPSTPILISPEDNEILENIEANFIWSSSDPDDDVLSYTLELRNGNNNEIQRFENITDTTFTVSPLTIGTKYFWQIIATDNINDPVGSAVSAFEVTSSPTENRFLFVRNINGNNVIFSANEDGDEFQLTDSNTNSFRPRRNVAAGKIAYFQTSGSQIDIFTMNRDGTEKTKITSSVRPNGFNLSEIGFSWPANSDKIYFPNFNRLYSINTNGQGLTQIYETTDGSLISEVSVSQNNNMIALKTNDINGYNVEIFTIDMSGTLLQTILTGVAGAASGLNLSATNQRIMYARDVSGFEDASGAYRRFDSRLFIYEFTSGVENEVSYQKPGGTNDLEPRFSPNEAEIIFTNTSNDGISQRNVFKIVIEDDDSRELLFENAFNPDWE
ncbi:carboxypeptidase-like regulatory domain-containing protein [Aequorivita echinoideorum]|nr:carboxypeptidase-like regulatory domain-containing protein [Aequorivita echinoideorum]